MNPDGGYEMTRIDYGGGIPLFLMVPRELEEESDV